MTKVLNRFPFFIIMYIVFVLLLSSLLAVFFLLIYTKYHNGKFIIRSLLFLLPSLIKRSKGNKIDQFKSRCHTPDKSLYILGNIVFIAIDILFVYALMSHFIFFSAVMSGSMTGTVDKGDLIFMTSAGDVEVGDIIMFDAPNVNYPVTHRVYDITSNGIITKGDFRNTTDNWVIPKEDIQAQAVLIFGDPIVIPDVGNYFIVGDEFDTARNIGVYGDEYQVTKNFMNMIKSYGLVIFMLVLSYILIDILRGN